jgi:hypothetical protein
MSNITQNAFDLTRANREGLQIIREPFPFESQADEREAATSCYVAAVSVWETARASGLAVPQGDRAAFDAGWAAHRRFRSKESRPIALGVQTEGVDLYFSSANLPPSARHAFTVGWNGAALWVNENVPTVQV